MATDKEKFAAAKAYIKRGDIEPARRLLKQIDHPSARELLSRLPPKPINWGLWAFIAVLIVGVIVFSAFAITSYQGRQEALATIEAINSE